MARNQRVEKNARRNTFYLTPVEEYGIDTIQKLRRQKRTGRDSPSEIIADLVWYYLKRVHRITKEELERILRIKHS